MTHILSSQQNQSSRSENGEKGHTTGPGMESLTASYQANKARVGRRTVWRRDIARLGIESLTYCQANRTRVGVRTVIRNTAGPGMESLTFCQANGIRAVGVTKVRWDIAKLAKSLTLYGIQPIISPSKASLFQFSVIILINCSLFIRFSTLE